MPVTDKLGQQNQEDLENLLSDLEPHRDSFAEIIPLWDSTEWLFRQQIIDKFPWVNTDLQFWNKKRALQFTRNSNVGLKYVHSKGEDCILINQDCTIPDASCLPLLKGKGIASARSVEPGSGLIKYLGDFKREKIAGHFPFYCTYFSWEVLDKVGFLDEKFKKLFSDDDLCLRCHLAGFPVEVVNLNIYHKGSHVVPDKDGNFQSPSGCYDQSDLMTAFEQYRAKYNLPETKHEDIIKTVLERSKDETC